MIKNRHNPPGSPPILRLLTRNLYSLKQGWQSKSRLQRSGLFTGAAALFLLLCLPLAELLLSLNPYEPVTVHVGALLASQPDFENRLETLDEFKEAILPPTALQTANDLILRYSNENPDSPNTAGNATAESPVEDPLQFITTARAILSLQKTLDQPTPAPQLAAWLGHLQQEDALLRLQAVEQIYRQTPALLSRLYEIRRANLTLMRHLNTLSGKRWLDTAASISTPPSAAESHLNPLPAEWQGLNRTSQSLEIQLANITYLLNQILREIEPVYRQDQVWGFSFWLKTAAWIHRYQTGLLALSAGMLAVSLLLLFGKPLPHNLSLSLLVSRLNVLSQSGRKPIERGKADQSFAAQSNWLVKGLARRAPARPLRLARRGSIRRPHLLIPVSGESLLEKPLPGDGILRIGNDPSFPVKIPLSGAEYIELWIRKARKGYFLEVMFSDTAVLVNQQPVLSARTLNDGDSIQIHDTVLIFRER